MYLLLSLFCIVEFRTVNDNYSGCVLLRWPIVSCIIIFVIFLFSIFTLHFAVLAQKQCIIVMRHGARLDSANPNWELTEGRERPYDTPLTDRGKVEVHEIACKRFKDMVEQQLW